MSRKKTAPTGVIHTIAVPRGRPALTYRANRRNALRAGEPAPVHHGWQQKPEEIRYVRHQPGGGFGYRKLTREEREQQTARRAFRLTVTRAKLQDFALTFVADVFNLGPRARSRGG